MNEITSANDILETFSKQFNIPKTHVTVGIANLIACNNDYKTLFINRRLPNTGWSIIQIQNFLYILSIIDTNNKTSIENCWYDDSDSDNSDSDNDNCEVDNSENDDITGIVKQQQQQQQQQQHQRNLDDTNEIIVADATESVASKSSLTQAVSKKQGRNVKNDKNKKKKNNNTNQNTNNNNNNITSTDIRWCSVGEREGRVYSSLVLQRHYGLCHGIGRSGNIIESQPKAIGSTILYKLSLLLLIDILKRCCQYNTKVLLKSTKNILLLPLCTGMTLSLVLSTIRNIDNKRIVLLQKQQQQEEEQQQLEQKQQSSIASTTTNEHDSTTASTGGMEQQQQQQEQYKQRTIVLWNRVDQKSCYKAIISAGLQCIVVPTQLASTTNNENNDSNNNDDDSVITNITVLQELLIQYENQILAIITTTSCFAPRVCDTIDSISKIILNNYPTIYHIINNAYGIQCPIITKLINRSCTIGKVDAIISSTDKNFLVPVGGAIVLSPNSTIIDAIGKTYAGRASNAPIIDIFITLLSMGINGYQRLYNKRQQMIGTFQKKLSTIATKYNGQLLHCPTNTISYAIALPYDKDSTLANNTTNITTATTNTNNNNNNISMIGSMLYQRCVSGTRVVSCNEIKTIESETFIGYGSSIDNYPYPYLTAACAIGLTYNEMNEFFKRLDKTLYEYYYKKKVKQQNNSQKANQKIQEEIEEIEEEQQQATIEKVDSNDRKEI